MFSIKIEYLLNVHGVVIATRLKVLLRHLYITQTQHNNGGHRGDGIPAALSMIFIRLWEHSVGFCVAGFQKCLQKWSRSHDLNDATGYPVSLLMSHFRTFKSRGTLAE